MQKNENEEWNEVRKKGKSIRMTNIITCEEHSFCPGRLNHHIEQENFQFLNDHQ